MRRQSRERVGVAAIEESVGRSGCSTGGAPGERAEGNSTCRTDGGSGGWRASSSVPAFGLLAAGWLLVGTYLRCARLGTQVFGGDEGHLLWAVLEGRFPELLFSYQPADYSLPMAAFARALLLITGRVSDLSLRALPLVSGVGLLLLAIAARRLIGDRRVVLLWLSLIALSPALIAYSRIARSYGPATTFALAAAMAMATWLKDPRMVWGVLGSAAGALAVYFHPLVGLLPASAFCVTWFAPGAPRPDGRRREVLFFALLWGAMCASFMIPGGSMLLASLSEKGGRSPLSAGALVEAWRLLSGSRYGEVAVAITLFGVIGVARGLARRDALTFIGLAAVLLQVGLVSVASPIGLEGARVLGRYLLPAWPWVLLWAASGFVVVASSLARRLEVPWVVVPSMVVLVLMLGALGPVVGRDVGISSFLHANEMLGFTRPLRSAAGLPVPEPYRRLGSDDGALIEFPLHYAWAQSVAVQSYQRIHGRRVLVSRPFRPWNEPELRLNGHVAADAAAFLEAPARYLLVHRDPAAEERRVLAYLKPMARREYTEIETLRAAASEMEGRLRVEWGSPDLESAEIAAWDLDRVRRSLRVGGSEPERRGPAVAPVAGPDSTRGAARGRDWAAPSRDPAGSD